MSGIKIIYVYDAMCGWCYGFSPVIKALYDKYCSQLDFEVISGGMMTGERSGTVEDIAPFIKTAYKTVEDTAGIKFGEAYLQHLHAGGMMLDSEKPAIALSVFKSYQPDRAVSFVHELQNSLFFDGKDVLDNDLYRYLAANHDIDPDEFERKMGEEQFRQDAHYDFALAKQLQVTGYPAVLMQVSDSKFYLVGRGYADYETMELRITNVIAEIGAGPAGAD